MKSDLAKQCPEALTCKWTCDPTSTETETECGVFFDYAIDPQPKGCPWCLKPIEVVESDGE